MFNAQCEKFHGFFNEGEVYSFENVIPKVIKNSNWKRGSVNYSLIVNNVSSIAVTVDENIPEYEIKYDKFSSLKTKQQEKVNICGIVLDCGELKKVNNDLLVREIILGDGQTSINLSLWNATASSLSISNGHILNVEQTRVKSYRGKVTCSGGIVTTKKDENETRRLQFWWNSSDTKSLPHIEMVILYKLYPLLS